MTDWTKQKMDAWQQMMRYCAYRERCHQEVRSKLLEIKVYGDDLEEIIAQLITDNFLNEERYARSFVRGKFRINKWGRHQIERALHAKKISAYCIRKGFEEIDEEEYHNTIENLILKKKDQLAENHSFLLRKKIAAFLINKGYEPELIWEKLLKMIA